MDANKVLDIVKRTKENQECIIYLGLDVDVIIGFDDIENTSFMFNNLIKVERKKFNNRITFINTESIQKIIIIDKPF